MQLLWFVINTLSRFYWFVLFQLVQYLAEHAKRIFCVTARLVQSLFRLVQSLVRLVQSLVELIEIMVYVTNFFILFFLARLLSCLPRKHEKVFFSTP